MQVNEQISKAFKQIKGLFGVVIEMRKVKNGGMRLLPPVWLPIAAGVVFLGVVSKGAQDSASEVDRSGIFCFFEDFSETTGALNSGEGGGRIPFVGASHQVTEGRFGHGALSIQADGDLNRGGLSVQFASGELAELSSALEKFTVCLWIKSKAEYGGQLVWRIPRNASTPGGFTLLHNRERVLYFSALDAEGQSGRAISPRLDLPEGEWVHIAFTFESGAVTFYVNGEQHGMVKFTGLKEIPQSEPSSSYISFFHGTAPGTLVDDLGFFTAAALSPSEIEVIYTSGLEKYLQRR